MTTYSKWRASGNFFKHNHYQIYYRYQRHPNPDKPTLLMLHGYPTASWDWHKVWPALSAHFSLLCYDYLGYGSSDKPSCFDYNTSFQANISECLLDYLELSECYVLAHDYGDTVLQELLARQNAQRLDYTIKAATMLNGGIFIAVNRPILIQKLMLSPLGPLIGKLNNRYMFAQSLQRVFSKQHPLSECEIDQLWSMICYKGGRTLLPKLQEYLHERKEFEQRWRAALIESSCPLMFISGDLDTISGQHMREYYAEHMPNARTAQIQVGHYPQLEAPDEVVQHTVEFINSL